MAADKGRHPQLLNAVMDINNDRRPMVVSRLKKMIGELDGRTIGLLGLSFKPNTDDMRDSPSVDVAKSLQEQGAKVRAFDPVAMKVAAPLMPGVEMTPDPYSMAEGCDALLVITDWNEFKHLDLERIRDLMKQPVLFDARNIYEPEKLRSLGFNYRGFGRGYNGHLLDAKLEQDVVVAPA
jgi:UDPglucose 6-dehydrogenase